MRRGDDELAGLCRRHAGRRGGGDDGGDRPPHAGRADRGQGHRGQGRVACFGRGRRRWPCQRQQLQPQGAADRRSQGCGHEVRVEREIASIENVKSVVNELAVDLPSSFTSRSNDSLITGKVKASFVDSKEMHANAVKVVTERGVVYLMGRVTQREGDLAGEIARNVSGVQKVVKLFDYISEEELRQMSIASGL